MKRNLISPYVERSPFWARSLRSISPLYAATVLLVSQNLWFFTSPARADKIGGGGTICAVPGKDGSPTVGSSVANTYYPGAAGVTASAGTNSITVGTSSGFSSPIQPGDLLLVIQMQGAEINSTNTGAYGDGDSSNNGSTGLPNFPTDGTVNGNTATNFTAGNFEYVVATNTVATSGGTIILSSSLVNSYVNADNTGGSSQGQKRFQVVRVPQYANLTVSGTIAATPWNGSTGGVVAIDVVGSTTFTGAGQINVDGQGFRGGGGRQLGGGAGANTDVVSLSTINNNASKGEGVAGTPRYLFNPTTNALVTNTQEGYPNGSYGRGAPGNAGGGGTDGRPSANDENAGGGGGSNGGSGGRGGRTWNSVLPYGGAGGAPFSVASARRLILGGGGGAGTTNNGTGTPGAGLASSGAPGGGIVLLRTGTIAGTGTISAKGATPAPIPANDASGGGGAGGSVLVISQTGSSTGLSINVSGGRGGTNTGGGAPHGPGGGGSGGVVLFSPGATTNVSGGAAGTTNNDATNFGGATAGDGVTAPISVTPADATTSISGASCIISAAKSTSTPGPMVAPGTATYTITASNPTGTNRSTAENVVIADSGLPTGFTNSSATVTPVYSGGATGPATVTTGGTASQPSWSGFKIPPGGNVAITFTVNIANGTTSGTYNNSATAAAQYSNTSANVTSAPTGSAPVTSTYNGTSPANTAEDVTIVPVSPLQVDKTVALAADSDNSSGTTPGDILEYTVAVRNTSTTTSVNNVILSDPLPTNTAYVPSSLQITAGANTGSKTDAVTDDQAEINGSQIVFRLGTGATSSAGGSLGTTAANNTTTVKFRVKINDPLPAGTTQLLNQAVVSSTGFANAPSNDPGTPAPNDPTVTPIRPRLRLVKRITGIKKEGSATVTAIGGYNNLATDNNDNPGVNWPGGSNTYLLGAINGTQIPTPNPGAPAPKDEVEYTIYFLSDSTINANNVNLCDFVPAKQTLVPGTIQLNFGGTTTAVTEGSGAGPGSGFYTATFPVDCTGINSGRGAVRIQVGTVTNATSTPSTSYGFFRFRAKVD
ncbi:beta strand repeat-containing protein [Phormidesmis sp. 146-33]